MKTRVNQLFLFLFIFISFGGFSQSLIVTFTGIEEETSNHVSLDSVFIENISKNIDTLLIGDTSIVLNPVAGFNENFNKSIPFELQQNYPNPFQDKTSVALSLSQREELSIYLFDGFGKKLAELKDIFGVGIHSFTIYGNQSNLYLLKVIGHSHSAFIKLINNNPNSETRHSIIYSDFQFIGTYFKTARSINEFPFTLGDEMVYTGFAGGYEISEIEDSPELSTDYTFEFTPLYTFNCGDTFTDERDNKVYQTVQIGNQCWIQENLNFETGSSWCYDNDTANCEIYGRLYTWYSMMNGASSSSSIPSGVQGICPTGWHIPSDAELTILTDFLGGIWVAGGKMKESGFLHWYSPNTGGTNESGFTALPGGYRNVYTGFNGLGSSTNFWSTTEDSDSTNYVWGRFLRYDLTVASYGYFEKNTGWSVRCIKDINTKIQNKFELNSVPDVQLKLRYPLMK